MGTRINCLCLSSQPSSTNPGALVMPLSWVERKGTYPEEAPTTLASTQGEQFVSNSIRAYLLKSGHPVGLVNAFRAMYRVPYHRSKVLRSRTLKIAEAITILAMKPELWARKKQVHVPELLWSKIDDFTRDHFIYPGHRLSRDNTYNIPFLPLNRPIDWLTTQPHSKPTENALTTLLNLILCQINMTVTAWEYTIENMFANYVFWVGEVCRKEKISISRTPLVASSSHITYCFQRSLGGFRRPQPGNLAGPTRASPLVEFHSFPPCCRLVTTAHFSTISCLAQRCTTEQWFCKHAKNKSQSRKPTLIQCLL